MSNSSSALSSSQASDANQGAIRSWSPLTILILNILLVSLFSSASLYFGSLRSAIAYFNHATVIPAQYSIAVGNLEDGQVATASFKLTNYGHKNVRVLGCSVGCICQLPDQLPFQIPPGRTHVFRVNVQAPKHSGSFHVDPVLFTDIPAEHELRLTIYGNAIRVPQLEEEKL